MARPGLLLIGGAGEDTVVALYYQVGAAVLPDLDRPHLPTQSQRHELHPIADAQDGHVELEELGLDPRGVVLVDAVGAAGEDDAFGVSMFDVFDRRVVGDELRVNPRLADPAGDQLGVLAAEVQDENQNLTTHPDALGALLEFALRIEGRREHDLGLLELLYILVTGGRHAHPQSAHQVEGPVVLVGRPDEDLLYRPRGPGAYAGAARECRVEGRHPPRVATPRRLFCFRKRAAQHDGVGPAGYGPGNVAASTHAAVGDDVDVIAGLQEVAHPGGRGVGDGGSLRHPDPDHTARRADAPRTDADQDAHGPGAHEVERCRVTRASPDDDGDVQRRHELHEVEGLDLARDVLGGDDRTLDDEHVEAGLDGCPVVALDPLGGEGGGGYDAPVLYLLDAAEDQLLLDGLRVDVLHHPRGLRLGKARYLLKDRPRVLVARLQPLQVEDC